MFDYAYNIMFLVKLEFILVSICLLSFFILLTDLKYKAIIFDITNNLTLH